jgi:hypothetical protein
MPKWRSWTAEEVAKLQNMAGKYPTAQIAAELGRGVSSIAIKAHELGISLRVQPYTGLRKPIRARQGWT